MTIPEIRQTCIDASETYYKFLEDKGGGVYNIYIRKIEKVGADKLKLNISGNIFDEETLVFKNLAVNKEYTIEDIRIQVYDRDTHTVIIKPKEKIYNQMVNANVNDWLIISDLKFLIEPVKEWYKINGKDIALPLKKSSLEPPKSSIFFKDETPSKEQVKALDVIFNKPFTYIWGAPGTGKTQFVLSYAILHYIANKKKVAIVAPTNHALEQIYRGVIKMTDKAGISRDNIIRLGGPSKKFADEFPEVCEIIGLENQLKQLNVQINLIERILGIDQSGKEQEQLEKTLKVLSEITSLISKEPNAKKKCADLVTKLDNLRMQQQKEELQIKSITREQNSLEKRRDSTLYAITSIFTKKINFKSKIDDLIEQQVRLDIKLNNTKTEKGNITTKIEEAIAHHTKLKNGISSNINLVNGDLKNLGFQKITIENVEKVKADINEKIVQLESDRPVNSSLAIEYQHLDKASLNAKYLQLKKEQNKLEHYSTEQRLKNVSIVGATLDTYLYRFQNDKLGVDHIFLDEAGYSNIIKAMTLFNQNVPVTFLGDHMQLPTVCEISKQDIQKNEDYRPVMVWDQSAIFLEDLFTKKDLNSIVLRYLSGAQAEFISLAKSNLTSTFRFGSSLAKVLKKYVYPEGFTSKLKTETEIIVYQVNNLPNNRVGNRLNKAEVEAITSLLNKNYSIDDSVAVLAPYNVQVQAIGKNFPEYQKQNKILTVHKSQGQEWDTVIYSVCDIGNGKSPWFTNSQNGLSNGLNNINTAISRTKKTLIVVCNPEEWNSLQGQLITGILGVSTKSIVYQA